MTEFNYEAELAKAREAAVGLQSELETRILGQERPGWSCNCGALHAGAAKAEKVMPAGRDYEYQITMRSLWTVKMRDDHGKEYSCGLSEFLAEDEIKGLFACYFKDVDGRAIQTEYFARQRREEEAHKSFVFPFDLDVPTQG